MSDINSVSFTGRVGQQPELKYTQGGQAILEITFAVSGRKKVREEWQETTTWLRTTMWGKRAEGLAKIINKGERIGVTGSLVVREFDRKDGGKVTSVEVFSDDVVLLGGKRPGAKSSDGPAPMAGYNPDESDKIPF